MRAAGESDCVPGDTGNEPHIGGGEYSPFHVVGSTNTLTPHVEDADDVPIKIGIDAQL